MVLATLDSKMAGPDIAPATTKIMLVVEYDGADYFGFQFQMGQPTVQAEIEAALQKLTGERVRVLAASRTDTGVHARAQVVSFRTKSLLPAKSIVNGLNYYLPDDIAVKSAARIAPGFDVRRQAISREYRYYILNGETRSPLLRRRAYLVRGCLDISAMNRACQHLVGKHDFASFASSLGNTLRSTVRHVYQAEVKREGELGTFIVVANSFLPHQVRNTIGSLLRVGMGKMNLDEFCSIIEAHQPGLAGPTAPAHGLCLEKINYPVSFEGIEHEDLCSKAD